MNANIIFRTGVIRTDQRALASTLRVSEPTVSRWKNHPEQIPAGMLELIFTACNVTDDEVLEFFGRRKK